MRATARQASLNLLNFRRMKFHYVYILESLAEPGSFYTGMTDDLHDRLRRHNGGEVSHTAKFKP